MAVGTMNWRCHSSIISTSSYMLTLKLLHNPNRIKIQDKECCFLNKLRSCLKVMSKNCAM